MIHQKVFKEIFEDRVRIVRDIIKELETKGENLQCILDLGCGNGEITVEVTRNLITPVEIYGVDINDNLLKKARERGIIIFHGDLNSDKLPFQDESIDLALALEVIEHLYNTDNFLSEIYRVLRHNGYFILTTPNLSWWINRVVLLFGYQPYLTDVSLKYDVGKLFKKPSKATYPGDHIRMFTLPALRQLLSIYNFKIVKLKGSTFKQVPSLLRSIDKLVAYIRPQFAANIIILARKI
mgnify:CR=1 FL=1